MQTLINEMSLAPFHKPNCIAMLNTLYPPVAVSQPTPQLTPTILASQRTGFFRYISAVDKKGPEVLNNLMNQGKRPGEENGWPSVREVIDNYLRCANAIIEECCEITDLGSLDDSGNIDDPNSKHYRKRSKADSGISFGSGGQRPPSSNGRNSSAKGRYSSESNKAEKPLPPSPIPALPKQGGSTLERIARELRKMRSKGDVKEKEAAKKEAKREAKEAKETKKSLRKMRSAGSLGNKNRSLYSADVESEAKPSFDVDEMRRQRQIWEAQARQASGAHTRNGST